MELFRIKIPEFLKKYRYAALVLLLGVALMLIPGRKSESPKQDQPQQAQEQTLQQSQQDLTAQLETILGKIDGAGRVSVLLSRSAGEEVVYQENEEIVTSGESGTVRRQSVTVTDASRNEQALIRQVRSPEYQGAVIVCQGADSASVRLAVTDAVSKATGLGADRITVLKMK